MFAFTGLWSAGGIGALLTQRYARLNAQALAQSQLRLATAQRINSAVDDPAGLIASQSLAATLAALDAETRSNERAVVQADTADGALGQVSDLLNDAKTLVAANANDAGLSADEKQANQVELDSILSSVDRISSSTSFLGTKLLDGSATISASGQTFALNSVAASDIGKTTDDSTSPAVTYTLADLSSGKALNITDGNLTLAGQVIDRAINDVATERGGLGSFQTDTLQSRLTQIGVAREDMLSSISQIRDTDYAAEVSRNVRAQLLQSISISMLRTANHQCPPGSIFSMLA